MLIGLRPDHENIRQRAVGDPHLGAVQNVTALHFRRRCLHSARVGTCIRLGQAKAADKIASSKFGQVFLALLI